MQAKIWNVAKIVTTHGKNGVSDKVIAPLFLDDNGRPQRFSRQFAQGYVDSMNSHKLESLNDKGELVEKIAYTLFNLTSE